jgi:phenylacetate-CoA ligase
MSLYSTLVRDLFVPLALWHRGETAQLRYRREFEATQYLPEEELRHLQWRRLQALLRHAHARCPYYRRRFAEAGLTPDDVRSPEDFRRLPALEKHDIQQHGADMIAEGWPAGDLIRNQTGGSTGTPITFYLCRDRKCSRAAATLRHNRWAGWEVGDPAAVIWGAPRDRPAGTFRAKLHGLLTREPMWLDCGALTEAAMDAFRGALARARPKIIQAYAGAAALIARWLEATGKKTHRPQAIVTSAEVLTDDDRALLQRVFGCPVFNRYGCREVSVVASECDAHAGLHVMAEGLYLEIDAGGRPARPGEVGSVLVTDLLNPAMPLIRYRIGDMASWASGTCACGRGLPRLEKLAGRVTEFLVGGDGRFVSGVFLATYVVAHRPSLGQVQIHQDRPGHVVYRLRPGPGFDPAADGDYLRQSTRQHLGPQSTCDLEVVAELPRTASGKFVFSCSSVSPAFLHGRATGSTGQRAGDAVVDTIPARP